MKYVALLRGINVGGNNKISMKELKLAFENAGYSEVATYINSGNIVFSSNQKDTIALAEDIEGLISKTFNLAIKTLVVEASLLLYLQEKVPEEWTHDSTEQRCDVLFLWPEIDNDEVLTKIIKTSVDELAYYPGVVVWRLARKDYTQSGMHKLIGSEVYKKSTARNINTVRKLAGMLKE